MSVSYPPIPYGLGNFRVVRRDGFCYVDKTRFVRPSVSYVGLALVYHGWELAHAEAVEVE